MDEVDEIVVEKKIEEGLNNRLKKIISLIKLNRIAVSVLLLPLWFLLYRK